ncbi:Acyl dehydratase [Pseudooceanicola antarcticus]|uniref:Acyl dehydratase n=1 Tax=Pseudooceanicola antarcticus TaxID=1247613 RepID=A0A285HKB5_9RHOB|nr:MaoC family dehydratase [Pseudooceanicola antarcticus]PJE27889.1 MaoC family dehydratase [Pseudooceanicola antarcticus]SNY36190.1 Acyl dehydratase [Pseudooceanicola antarcticus]
MSVLSRTEFKAMIGQELGLSDWIEVSQQRIDEFARCTEDLQYIHTDPSRAAQSPFGTTIAHGFLTLSLLSKMVLDMPQVAGTTMAVNYGMNRMRFISPVPSGARIRGRFTLKSVEEIRPGEIQTTTDVVVEIEGKDKPALVAEWLGRRYFGDNS